MCLGKSSSLRRFTAFDTVKQQKGHLLETPVDGRPDPLHEDVGSQAFGVCYALLQRLAIQVVAATLPLRLQHKVLWPGACLIEHLLRPWIPIVVQAP